MIGIYKITNPKGKIYIGKSISIEERMNSYKYEGSRKHQPKINNSISKYGIENHEFEVIEYCSLEELNSKEIFWINKFDSIQEGLNCSSGGEGGPRDTKTKHQISHSLTGKKASDETKTKMRNSKLNHPMYNNEWKETMKKTTWSSGTSSKPIIQLSLKGEFIQEFKSLTKAVKSLNKIHTGPISNCLNKRTKSSYGYIWKYKK
jgi:group I intron endonuclease